MKKFTKILAGVTALVLSFGIVGCGWKDSDFPSFKPSGDGTTNVETSEKYTVNVRSAGGMKLNGIRVSAYNSSGVKVRSGISSDGVINFNLSLGNYTLEVDETSLPDGYYLEEGVTYATNPEKREAIDIKIPSKVISQAATADKVYSIGEIMNDFTLKDYRSDDNSYTGTRNYKLSDILSKKKAVILNFWYPTCTFCIQEFPALQQAYSAAKSSVEVIGVCFAGYSNANVADFVEKYKNDFTLTFPLCVDTAGIQKRFNVESAPTTIVIDRYGMIAFRESGGQPTVAFWQELFKKYTSDDYVQDVTGGGNTENGGNNNTSADREIPNVTMPSSAEMAAAASANGLTATYRADTEDEYAWPWTTGSDDTYGSVITTTNTGKQNSYATLHVDIELKQGDLLSFDYFVSSEKNNDNLYVLLDGQLLNGDGWSGINNEWTSYDAYVADRDKTVKLSFIFQKDSGDNADVIGQDCAKIRNIRTSKVSADSNAIDVIREAASGTFASGKYAYYVTPVFNPADGFYHVGSEDGPLLYISLTNITPWSKQHTENDKFTYTKNSQSGTQYATVYNMSYYKYAETVESADGNSVLSFTMEIDGKDFASALSEYNHMLDMLEKPYQLMPVSKQLQNWAAALVKEIEAENNATAHESEWLEFCFYYDHYGKAHVEDDVCLMDTDVTKGLTIYNPYEIGFTSTPNDSDRMGMVTGNVEHSLTRPNGVYYKFTAPKDGVYQIRDYECTSTSLALSLYTMQDDKLTRTFEDYCDGVQDFDGLIPTGYDENNNPIYKYNMFNKYVVLSKGEPIYMLLFITEQTTGTFTFDITYHDRVEKLMNCSTADGAWTYDENNVFVYLGINAAVSNGKYYMADAEGNPDLDKPIYINMIYSSFFTSELEDMNFRSLETLIDNNVFYDPNNPDETSAQQANMVTYLNQSTQGKDPNDELYGLVEADENIVNIINNLIAVQGGAGDNRGWMAFACYKEILAAKTN